MYRLVVFRSDTGACLAHQELARSDGAQNGGQLASKLHAVNQLLAEATQPSGPDEQGGTAQLEDANLAAGNKRLDAAATVLGMGARRLAGRARRPQLLVQQWHTGSEQWHLAEDAECGVVVAVCLPHDWSAAACTALARGVRDAFVQTHRPQLLSLAAAGPQPLLSSSSLYTRDGASTIMTLPALKLLARLALDAQDALYGDGQQPHWVFFAHVSSFMGHPPRRRASMAPERDSAGDQPGSKRASGAGGRRSSDGSGRADAPGGGGDGGKGKPKSLFKSVLGALRLGDKGRGKEKEEKGKGEGAGAGQRKGAAGEGGEEGGAGGVGPLQHIVMCPTERLVEAAAWEPHSIAAAVLQVRPPDDGGFDGRTSVLGGGRATPGGAGAAAAPGPGPRQQQQHEEEEGGLPFPELEDVELELELQLPVDAPTGGGPPRLAARRFLVVGVRHGHVVGVVALPTSPNAQAPAGSSRVRWLLGPVLGPLSGLFHFLGRHANPEEVEAHGLLVRLMD